MARSGGGGGGMGGRSGGGGSFGGSRGSFSGHSSSSRPSSSGSSYRPSSNPRPSSYRPSSPSPSSYRPSSTYRPGTGYGGGYRPGSHTNTSHTNSGYSNNTSHRPSGGGGFAALIPILVIVGVFLLLVLMTSGGSGSHSSIPASTHAREKLLKHGAFIDDCVTDEMGWLVNENKTEKELKEFWEETGVQPYLYLKDYDPAMASVTDRGEWAAEFYDQNFNREDVFLFVYYADSKADAANAEGTGDYYYYMGDDVQTVLDDEAIDILLGYMNAKWDDLDLDWDNVFYESFQSTGKSIMKVTTTGRDIFKWILMAVAAIAAGVGGTAAYKEYNRRKKEKEDADQAILNTSIDDLIKDEADKAQEKADELTDMYLK